MRKLIVLATALFSAAALAGDIDAGKAKSAMCAGCHGANGIAMATNYPNLAGQNEGYLISSINAYKTKQRSGGQAPMMYGMVAALNDADVANIAAYYSSLE